MDKFSTVVMPVAERLGMTQAQERPSVSKVHNYWVPGA
jgi:hypothetical protein